jgi:urocanate hydratase
MIPELLFQQACKGAVIVAAGIGGMGVLASEVYDECLLGVRVETIRELGSFGLVAIFVLGILWAIKGAAPKALDFLKDAKDGFLSELSAIRTTHAEEMTQARIANAQELAQERASREAQVDAFREMMSAHRTAMEAQFSALKQINEDGNKAINSLVEELKERPCQK